MTTRAVGVIGVALTLTLTACGSAAGPVSTTEPAASAPPPGSDSPGRIGGGVRSVD